MELNHHLPVYKTGLYRFKLTVQKVWWVRRPFSLLGLYLPAATFVRYLRAFPYAVPSWMNSPTEIGRGSIRAYTPLRFAFLFEPTQRFSPSGYFARVLGKPPQSSIDPVFKMLPYIGLGDNPILNLFMSPPADGVVFYFGGQERS